VQAKKLELNRDVGRALKSWKLPTSAFTQARPLTLRSLLAHTAGLVITAAPGYEPNATLPSLEQILNGAAPARAPAVRFEERPGDAVRISTADYAIVQQLVTDAAKHPFADFAADTVFGPLGMTRSTFRQPPSAALLSAVATGHDATGRPVAGKWRLYPDLAASGLWSTPADLARLVLEIQRAYGGKRGKVLKPGSARQMLSPEHVGWPGLGVTLAGRDASLRFRAAGATRGFETELVGFVKRGQGAVIMTNTNGGSALSVEILNAIASVYGWPDYVPAEKVIARADPRVYDRFVGTYRLDSRVLSVVKRANRLFIGARGAETTELLPESVSDFFTTDSDASYSFVFDQNGKAQAFTVRQRDAYERWDRRALAR